MRSRASGTSRLVRIGSPGSSGLIRAVMLTAVLVLLSACISTQSADEAPEEDIDVAEEVMVDDEAVDDATIDDDPSGIDDEAADDTDAANDGETIRIAVRTALSGAVAAQGQEVLDSVQLAVDQWNETHGGEFVVEVVPFDDESDPDTGVAVSEAICDDDQIVAVIGSFQSAVGLPSSAVLDDCGLVYVAPGETTPELTDRGLDGVNRVSPRDDDQGPALAIYAVEHMGAERVFIIDDQSAGGAGLAVAFDERAGELGLETERAQIDVGQTDFEELLSGVPDDIDGLVFYGFLPEGALIAQQWADMGRTEPIMGGDPLYQQAEFVDASEGSAEGAVITFIGPDIRLVPDAEQYVEDYEAEYRPVSSYGPQGFEAASVILAAIDTLESVDREAMQETVRATSDFRGILGIPISFDERGDVHGGTIYVYRVVDGMFEQDQVIETR